MASVLVSDPVSPSRTTSSSRPAVTSSLSSTVAAALGAAAATLRMLGILSDVSLRTTEKGKQPVYDSGSDSDSDSSVASVDLIRGLRRTRRSDYHPETDLVLSGLAAYDTPVPVGSVYYWYF